MGLRLATGVTGAAVVVGAVWLGTPWLTLLALLGGGLAIREAYRLTPSGVGRMPVLLGVIAVVALLLAAETASSNDFHLALGLVLAGWAFAALLWFIACYDVPREPEVDELPHEPQDGHVEVEGGDAADDDYGYVSGYASEGVPWLDTLGTLPSGTRPLDYEEEADPEEEEWEYFYEDEEAEPAGRPWLGFLFLLLGPVYVGFLLGHGLALRDLAGGPENFGRSWLLFTLLVVFACDTGALAVGRLLGRHPMAPRISPNKTWEGAAGGLIASIGAALLVGVVFELGVAVWMQAVIGAAASVAAQVGDLAESALKRGANAKDSGSIMPGHGGILDRLDSILFALPAVFYLLLAAGFRL